jgi:hypothetical protein
MKSTARPMASRNQGQVSGCFGFWISALFRASDFGVRIFCAMQLNTRRNHWLLFQSRWSSTSESVLNGPATSAPWRSTTHQPSARRETFDLASASFPGSGPEAGSAPKASDLTSPDLLVSSATGLTNRPDWVFGFPLPKMGVESDMLRQSFYGSAPMFGKSIRSSLELG